MYLEHLNPKEDAKKQMMLLRLCGQKSKKKGVIIEEIEEDRLCLKHLIMHRRKKDNHAKARVEEVTKIITEHPSIEDDVANLVSQNEVVNDVQQDVVNENEAIEKGNENNEEGNKDDTDSEFVDNKLVLMSMMMHG